MGSELTVLNDTTIQEGGQGVDFSNKLFNLRPATLTIVQPQSQAKGAVRGNLRVVETGDQFSEITAVLLMMPKEQRNWYAGEPGEMNRTQANLMCFSTNMLQPHKNAKVPQAVNCANCSKSDWGPYREFKDKNGKANKNLIPPCDAHYVMFLIDTVYQLPLKMYIRSKAKGPFEQGMQNIARIFAMAKAQKKNPNIYDVKFKLSTEFAQDGMYGYYLPVISDAKFVTDEEKVAFGAIYSQFTSSQNQAKLESEQSEKLTEANNTINSVVEGDYVGEDKEITI